MFEEALVVTELGFEPCTKYSGPGRKGAYICGNLTVYSWLLFHGAGSDLQQLGGEEIS